MPLRERVPGVLRLGRKRRAIVVGYDRAARHQARPEAFTRPARLIVILLSHNGYAENTDGALHMLSGSGAGSLTMADANTQKNGHRITVPKSRYQRRRVENPRPKPWAFTCQESKRDAIRVGPKNHHVGEVDGRRIDELSAPLPYFGQSAAAAREPAHGATIRVRRENALRQTRAPSSIRARRC